MARNSKKRSRTTLLGAVGLLLLLAAMLPLGAFLAGILSGGGRQDTAGLQDDARSAGTLEVLVLRALDRSPVEGARIQVSGLSGDPVDATSDPQGRATLRGVGLGPVRVVARYEGQQATTWTDSRMEQRVLLAVAPMAARRGRVRFSDGTPVKAVVRLLAEDGEELGQATTDEIGRYELTDHPDAQSICVEPAEAAPAVALAGDVTVNGGKQVRGRVVGAGEGELKLFGLMPQLDDDVMLPFRATWRLGADGGFAGRLPEGVQVWGLLDGLPVRVQAGDVDRPAPARVEGRVTRSVDGSAAAGATLSFRPLLGADFPVPLPPKKVAADEQGRFVADLARTRYAVEVSAPGCATEVFADFVPEKSEAAFGLGPGSGVSGIVVDTDGLPVSGARVRAVCFPDPQGRHPVARDRTDAGGGFRLDGLGGELARIQITARGFFPTTLDGVRASRQLRVLLQRK